MLDLKQINITALEENDNYGKYSIAPLEKGYGQTIGNALRRVLLSSLSGTAITAVKIEGVKHEYTVLSGLSDDVIELVLNLKNLRLVSSSNEPVTLKLKSKGIKTITGADFEKNSSVEIKNPELVITELTDKKASLDLEIVVEKGEGYVAADNSKRSEVGLIPLDVDFSPIERVNFEVKKTRVGQVTDYDDLVLEIFTKSTIDPKEALIESSNIIRRIFRVLSGIVDEEITSDNNESKEEEIETTVAKKKKTAAKKETKETKTKKK